MSRQPDLYDGENEVAVIGARFLADRFEDMHVILNVIDDVAAYLLDEPAAGEVLEVINVGNVEIGVLEIAQLRFVWF